MKRILSHLTLSLAAMILLGLTAGSAYADGIIFVGPNHDNKIVPPLEVLSLQHHGNNTTESGGVSFNGSNDVRFGDTSAGPHNTTVQFSNLNTTANNLGILLNINEQGNQLTMALHIDVLTLTAYDSNGNATFIGSIENIDLDQFRQALGSSSDVQFGLDSIGAARLQAALLANPNLRLGLSATISGVDAGPERFSFNALNGSTPVPEPATMFLLGTGLAGVAAKIRKRRNAAKG